MATNPQRPTKPEGVEEKENTVEEEKGPQETSQSSSVRNIE